MSNERMLKTMDEARQVASVRQVFGEPTVVGDKTIIPIAAVSYAFGFGYGSGPEGMDDDGKPISTGGGGGGGGNATARPVALLEVSVDETRIKPVEDQTRIALASIAMAAWVVFWIAKTIRAFGGR